MHLAEAVGQSQEERSAFRDGLMHAVVCFIAHAAVSDDIESFLHRIAGEERGFSRALMYSESSIALENVFGPLAKVRIGDWQVEEDLKEFPVLRHAEWTTGVKIEQMPLSEEDDTQEEISKDAREILRSRMVRRKHNDRAILSLIDIPLWNRAGWRGVMYAYDPSIGRLPMLAFGFESRDAADQIFQGWRNRLGEIDVDERLRITIIRGISRLEPASYRLVVSRNIDSEGSHNKTMMIVSRKTTMTPETTKNLDEFLSTLAKFGRYLLVPATIEDNAKDSYLNIDLSIEKSELIVKEAWQIHIHDFDAMGLAPDDEPLIPEGVQDPPCREVIEFMRRRTSQ